MQDKSSWVSDWTDKNYPETYKKSISKDYDYLWNEVKNNNKIFVVFMNYYDNHDLDFLEIAQVRNNGNRLLIGARGISYYIEKYKSIEENKKDFIDFCSKVRLYYLK